MNKKNLSLFFLFLTVNVFAGGIPKTMPDDFYIRYSSYIGYNPHYRSIEINLKECSIMLDDPELSMISFVIDREELSTIYNALFALKAFSIKNKVTQFGDRGGEKIEYTIAGKEYRVDNSGPRVIIKSRMQHFIESIDIITACADRHRN
jgi:hypothetical protein